MMGKGALKWTAYIAAGAMVVAFSVPFVSRVMSGENGDQWVETRGVDPVMFAARENARVMFPHFVEQFKKANGATEQFFVKARFYAKNGAPTILWMSDLEIDGRVVWGRIANEPFGEMKNGLVLGSRASTSVVDIMDWSYPDGGLLRGNFTDRAYAKTQPENERASILEALHSDPLP